MNGASATWSDVRRLLSNIVVADGCIIWTGTSSRNGSHGNFSVRRDGRTVSVYVHRFAWEIVNGPIDPGMDLDHLCFVPLCVNPNHLVPKSPHENRGRQRRKVPIFPPEFRKCVPAGCGLVDLNGIPIGVDDHHPRLDGWEEP